MTREEVRAVLGPCEDRLVAEILATDATGEELIEAAGWLGSDEALVNTGHPLPAGRVARLVEILERAAEELVPPEPYRSGE